MEIIAKQIKMGQRQSMELLYPSDLYLDFLEIISPVLLSISVLVGSNVISTDIASELLLGGSVLTSVVSVTGHILFL